MMKKHTMTWWFRSNGIKSLLLMLLFLVMGVGESVGQIREGIAPEAIVEGVPYRLVIPASEGAVMALDHSDYSSINNQSYGVVRHTWNAPARCEQNFYGRKDEVYFFEKVAGTDDYCIKGYFNTGTKDAPVYEVRYLYGDGWKVSLKNESELNTNTKNYRFTISKSVSISGWEFTADGTDYVYIKCQNAHYVAPGRGFSEGSGVFVDAAKDRRKEATKAFLAWKVIPWDPLADLKDMIDKVQYIFNTASEGTAFTQVKAQSYITDLQVALDNASSTYNSLKNTYGTTAKTELMDDATFTSSVSTAIRTLVSARATYLSGLNGIDTSKTFTLIHEATGKVLVCNGAGIATLGTPESSAANEMTFEKSGNFYYVKSNGYYLRVYNDKPGPDGNNGGKNFDTNADLQAQWSTAADTRRQINIVRFDNKRFGLQFEYHTEGTYGGETRLWQGRGYLAPTSTLTDENLYPFMEDGITNPYSNWRIGLVEPKIIYDEKEGEITMSCATPGATIYYVGYDEENGPDPTMTDDAVRATLTEYTGTFDAKKTYYKAIAVMDNEESEVVCIGPTAPFHCATPIISIDKATGKVSITCQTRSATIYYISDSDGSFNENSQNFGGTIYTGTFTIGDVPIVKAIAVKNNDWSNVSEEALWDESIHYINSSSEMTRMNLYYKVSEGFTVDTDEPIGTAEKPFTGIFDGNFQSISLSHPLFGCVDGGTVKNVLVQTLSSDLNGTNVGAIVNEAQGNAKIYNCGVTDKNHTINATNAAGGIVGHIASGASVKVVNCYNYAKVAGKTYSGGIVGYNESTVDDGTRIAMCMMYGDMTTGTNRSPVYYGGHTSNNQDYTEYNYYRSRANLTYTAYNDQLAIDKNEYLTRFPFYRHILNTHRELAAFFLFHDSKKSSVSSAIQPTADEVAEIGHWVLNTEIAPYPIIEPWKKYTKKTTVDIAAKLPVTTERYAGKKLDDITADKVYRGDGTQVTTMGSSGMLRVNYSINGTSDYVDLPITDMDTLRYDYTWGKVVLPFANEFSGWTREYSKICTGWKITSVTKEGTSYNSFSIPTTEPYNFADRDNPQKDIYDATYNPYIFAQGGNYIVPYGVTEISIEANFATAYYLSDAYADFGYDGSYSNQTNLGWAVSTTYHEQPVYTNLETLVGAMSNSTNPHSQAIVLVGNYHYNQKVFDKIIFDNKKACSIMSIDEDCNQEPDYGWYTYQSKENRTDIPPLRFDFVANIGIGMAARVNGSTPNPSQGIWHSHGWFESTETSLVYMSECEINSTSFNAEDDGHGNNRWVVNSGYFEQIIRGYDGADNKLSYVQIGGNAFVNQYYPSAHITKNHATTLRPTLVTGGEVKECFMTGNHATAVGENIYFWCAGGYIHKYLSAYTTNITTATTNVTAKVDHAIIDEFFGGGTSASARITGDINITMNNSRVGFFCGGPEFGDMTNGKTVTTHANGSTFGKYYGAGFGGTSLSTVYKTESSNYNFSNPTFPIGWENYMYLTTNGSYGLGVGYAFDYILYAGGTGTGVARFYNKFARFSLATTGNVTNILEDCTIQGDFYGAGCQGKVDGTVTSTLKGCTIQGSAYGGGYKAENNTLDVYPNMQPTYSVYTKETGLFSDFGTVNPEKWHWEKGTVDTYDASTKTLYTNIDLTTLGNVTGAITLNIEDGTTVTGSVFGGGNESKSLNNAIVNVTGGTITHDVYGGGNKADVNGDTQVNLLGGTIIENVYGGGRGTDGAEGIAALVGSTQVNLNGMDATEYQAAYSAWGLVSEGDGKPYTVANTAKGCVVGGSIFGCNNINGTPQGNAIVHIYKTQNEAAQQIGNTNEVTDAKVKNRYDLTAVYGGGNLAPFIPAAANESTASTHVIIDGCDLTSIETVYGGGNAASTPATDVTVNGTYEIKELFGGGNGLTALPDGKPNPGANVGYKNYTEYVDVGGTLVAKDKEEANTKEKRLASGYVYGSGAANVTIYGGTIHQVFGGSNTKGNVRISAVTLLEDQDVCEFCVDEAYGGGKSAPMDAEAKLLMSCIPGLKAAYGGAEAANIEGDVTLNITNGNFDRVFGGNNKSGRIGGTITVNIEETGCKPVIIGQLYGGGNQAPYTAPFVKDDGGNDTEVRQHGPTLNIRSFTSIGEVYGGGYGEGAIVTGDTYVNINEVVGDKSSQDEFMKETVASVTDPATQTTGTDKVSKNTGVTKTFKDGDGDDANTISVDIPLHKKGDIGSIGVVFGGGNAAQVVGNTHVNIGTLSSVDYVTKASGESVARTGITPVGADIRGNVYGGGNNAEVTGDTHVVIGEKYEAPSTPTPDPSPTPEP